MTSFYTLSLYTLAGLLLGIGFMFPVVWPLGLIGVALHLWLLQQQTLSLLGSYIAWTIKFFFVLGFYWTIYPIRWLPFEFGEGELFLVGLYWLTVSLFLGTGGIVLAFLYRVVHRTIQDIQWVKYVAIPLVWVVAELSGSFLLSVFTLGPGSSVNAYFSLGYIGLLISEHDSLLWFAKLGGVYVLSLVGVMIAVFFIQLIKSAHSRTKQIGFSLMLFGALLGTSNLALPFSAPASELTSVATINTTFPVREYFDLTNEELAEKRTKALDAAVATNAAYIITPEASEFLDQSTGPERAKNFFNFRYANEDVILIDSGRVVTNGLPVLQGIVVDTKNNQYDIAHKKYLVPQGEFVPHLYEHVFSWFGYGFIISELQRLLSYRIGPEVSQAGFASEYPGILFCFESSSGTGVRDLLQERPNTPFIAHPVSHAWFNESKSLWSQLERSLKVQAVWNNVAIVSAAHHGPSQLFLPDGSIVSPEIVASEAEWYVGLFTVPLRQ